MFKKALLASLVLSASLTAAAAEFYVVVPVAGAADKANIAVALNPVTLPVGTVGQVYPGFDFKSALSVTGDSAFTGTGVSFTTQGTLPLGLAVSADGVLSGTPTAKKPDGTSFQVIATYKTKTGQQAYTIVVNGVTLDVTQLAVGSQHVCAVTTKGGATCWGANNFGQLGNNTLQASAHPVDVSGLASGVSRITVGMIHSCAQTTTGALKCWGSNNYGQLGVSGTSQSLTPVSVGSLTAGASSLSSGYYHNCAVSSAGGAKCWGANWYGQLGNGSTTNSATPVDAQGLTTGAAQVRAGNDFTCAKNTSNTAFCWGKNANGQLGNGGTLNSAVPVAVNGSSGTIASLAVGGAHACAITTTGSAKCWGYNQFGQLGIGNTYQSNSPAAVTGLSGVVALSAGGTHTCAVTSTGEAKCWGANSAGQLGTGTLSQSNSPVTVSGFSAGAKDISAGDTATCAITSTNNVKCWGDNASGQLGNTGGSSTVPVAVEMP